MWACFKNSVLNGLLYSYNIIWNTLNICRPLNPSDHITYKCIIIFIFFFLTIKEKWREKEKNKSNLDRSICLRTVAISIPARRSGDQVSKPGRNKLFSPSLSLSLSLSLEYQDKTYRWSDRNQIYYWIIRETNSLI